MMKYDTALRTARKTVRYLDEGDGNLSSSEIICYVAALDVCVEAIAKHNDVRLPDRLPIRQEPSDYFTDINIGAWGDD